MVFLAGVLAVSSTVAAAPPQLEVTATDPASAIDLPYKTDLYARVHYRADHPVRVQAVGMRDGTEVPGAVNPSPAWDAGEDDVRAWIGFRAPASIDRMRVTLYDEDWKPLQHVDVPMALSWRADAPAHERAAWVQPLNDEQQSRVNEDSVQNVSYGAMASVIVDLVLMSLPAYVLVQVLLIVMWRGRWRRRAMLPLVVMAGTLAVSILALLAGSNLWPIWMILLAPLALLYLVVLALLYWRARRRGAAA
jgi:hypothetical protein